MIATVAGKLAHKASDHVVVEVGGVGLRLFMSRRSLGRLGAEGQPVHLLVHTQVKQDAINLYGFIDAVEKEVFEHLISMSGLGPRLAVTILGGMDARELALAVCNEDIARLCTIPGIGKKKAERLVVHLKERLLAVAGSPEGGAPSARQVLEDLRSALANLGFTGPELEQAVAALQQRAVGGEQLEQLLPDALRLLKG